MGKTQDTLFEPDFNRSIKVQTFSQKITSHAGAVLLREADHQLGLIESLADQIQDPRNPEKIRYTTAELLRERIYAMALGSENQVAYSRTVEHGGSCQEVFPLCPIDPRLDCFGFSLVGGSAARQHHLYRMRIRYVT